MRIGDVEVHADFLENDNIQPGSRIPLNVEIANSSASGSFDEIRIRLNEVHSWNSIVSPKYSNSSVMTEVTKLSKKDIRTWTEHVDYRERRVIHLDNMSLDIPDTAKCDSDAGLVRIHHVLEVKLISRRYSVDNMRFRFPLVIGGKQYDHVLPRRHAVNYLTKKKTEQVLADAIAAVVSGITKSAEYWLEDPPDYDNPEPLPSSSTNRRLLSRQKEMSRSRSICVPDKQVMPRMSRPITMPHA